MRNQERVRVTRGEMFFADLSPVKGSEQGGTRPVLVLQNDLGNKFSPTTIVAAVTSRVNKPQLPTHVLLPCQRFGLDKDSLILLEQIRTIDKARLRQKVCKLDLEYMEKVEEALEVSLGLTVV